MAMKKTKAKIKADWKGKYEEKEAECAELFNRNAALKAKADQFDLFVNSLSNRVIEKLKEDDDWVREIACEEVDDRIGDLSIS